MLVDTNTFLTHPVQGEAGCAYLSCESLEICGPPLRGGIPEPAPRAVTG